MQDGLSKRIEDRFRGSWQDGWLPAALLLVGVVCAYQPVWSAGFIWDDDRYVTNNPLLVAPDGLWRIWFSMDSPSQYFPLTYTALRVEYGLWGLDPAGFHWMNILLHGINAVLVWKLFSRLATPGAWLAAALFALHPVQVESVAWISEQKNLLSLLFSLLAARAWFEFIQSNTTTARRDYWRALGFFALALFSKTTACTLPVALLLITWWQNQPLNRQRLGQLGPFVLLGLAMGLVAMWWERFHQGTEGKMFSLGVVERVLLASRAVWFYLGKLIWPTNLTFSYPKWEIQATDPSAYAWLLALVIAGGAIWLLRKRTGPGVAFAAVFYLATLSPLLGFVMVYTFRYTYVADHYQYVACLGPLTLAAVGLAQLRKRSPGSARVPGLLGLTGVLGLLGFLTWHQCGMFADAETLWRTTIARNPLSYMAHNNLGGLLVRSGRTDEAIPHFEKSLALQPDYAVACYNLGRAFAQKGALDEAIARFEQAVELDAAYLPPRINLGNALLQKGRAREALTQFEVAFKLRPRNADVLNNLAWLLATSPDDSLRDGQRAMELARQAVKLTGHQDPIHLGTLAAACAEAGQFPEAVSRAQQAGQIARRQANSQLSQALNLQMGFYLAGKPHRIGVITNSP